MEKNCKLNNDLCSFLNDLMALKNHPFSIVNEISVNSETGAIDLKLSLPFSAIDANTSTNFINYFKKVNEIALPKSCIDSDDKSKEGTDSGKADCFPRQYQNERSNFYDSATGFNQSSIPYMNIVTGKCLPHPPSNLFQNTTILCVPEYMLNTGPTYYNPPYRPAAVHPEDYENRHYSNSNTIMNNNPNILQALDKKQELLQRCGSNLTNSISPHTASQLNMNNSLDNVNKYTTYRQQQSEPLQMQHQHQKKIGERQSYINYNNFDKLSSTNNCQFACNDLTPQNSSYYNTTRLSSSDQISNFADITSETRTTPFLGDKNHDCQLPNIVGSTDSNITYGKQDNNKKQLYEHFPSTLSMSNREQQKSVFSYHLDNHGIYSQKSGSFLQSSNNSSLLPEVTSPQKPTSIGSNAIIDEPSYIDKPKISDIQPQGFQNNTQQLIEHSSVHEIFPKFKKSITMKLIVSTAEKIINVFYENDGTTSPDFYYNVIIDNLTNIVKELCQIFNQDEYLFSNYFHDEMTILIFEECYKVMDSYNPKQKEFLYQASKNIPRDLLISVTKGSGTKKNNQNLISGVRLFSVLYKCAISPTEEITRSFVHLFKKIIDFWDSCKEKESKKIICTESEKNILFRALELLNGFLKGQKNPIPKH